MTSVLSASSVLQEPATIAPGALRRTGTDGVYRGLAAGQDEPHQARLDLVPTERVPARRASLLRFLHCTDLHLVDWQSPGRFEFAQRFARTGPIDVLLPAYRPHEFLQVHALAAMLGTIPLIGPSPLTGAPLQFLLCTGDYVDNMQRNELDTWLALAAGSEIRPGSGDRMRDGVAAAAWNDPAYWCPEPWPDRYKERRGFPAVPGLLEAARRPFRSPGIPLPWLSVRGNHDLLVDGTAPANPRYKQLVVGARKARLLGRPFAHTEEDLDRFIRQPEAFLNGPVALITPDPARALCEGGEWLCAHLAAHGSPRGHGFGEAQVTAGTAYYVNDDIPGVRLIVLDTVNPGGHFYGSIDAAQLTWLEQRLIEVHGRYRDPSGREVRTGNPDRVVVLCSHHGSTSLTNPRLSPAELGGSPRVLGPELLACLHRFANLVLWVNGHTHQNRIRCHRDPGRNAGFWEVTTSSQIDWPCQTRTIELIDNQNGTLSVLTTMIDHAAPLSPGEGDGFWLLAALHRELAANDPFAGAGSSNHGHHLDRNVELVVPSPL